MVRTNQGGSVLSFVMIGAVMIALLVGGAYVVKQQLAISEAPPASSPGESKPEEAKKQPETPKEQDKKVSQDTQQPDKTPNTSSASNSGELPRTGPAELLTTVLALGLLSLAAVSYVRSRRPEFSFDI